MHIYWRINIFFQGIKPKADTCYKKTAPRTEKSEGLFLLIQLIALFKAAAFS